MDATPEVSTSLSIRCCFRNSTIHIYVTLIGDERRNNIGLLAYTNLQTQLLL